jgi:transposase
VWALEDVRGVGRGLERFLLEAGDRVVRLPPKLMAQARRAARTFGKSDSIDALAISRAALAHPELPVVVRDERARDIRLLMNHREPSRANAAKHRTAALAAARHRPRTANPRWHP